MKETLFALLLAIAIAPVARAHEGDEHKVMGTVTMAAVDHIMVKTTEDKEVTIQVTKDTKVMKGEDAMKTEDIDAGTRVVVTAVTEKDQLRAKLIQVGADPDQK